LNDAREVDTQAIDLPASMAPLVRGRAWRRSQVGEAGADVYRLSDSASAQDLFLKHGQGPAADELTAELVRLRWLREYLPVPDVRQFIASPGQAWLLTTALTGRTALEVLEDDPADAVSVVRAIALFLRRFHAIPIEQCPFNADHRLRLAQARQRMEAGLADTSDFDDEHAGWSAAEVWTEMTGLLPIAVDSVVTHGDFSLDNLLMQGGEVVGCIDLGRVGIADRYQDLAILWNNLRDFGDEVAHLLFEAYGIAQPDKTRLRFHLDLDEFF
jgi:aminoglycoside 3'-phosphotransferase-1